MRGLPGLRGVAVLWLVALCRVANAQSAAPPAVALVCATSEGGELRVAAIAESALSSCRGEVFAHGDGWWGYLPAPRDPSGLTPSSRPPLALVSGGTVEIRLAPPKATVALPPDTFIAAILRGREEQFETDRVLCRRTAKGADRAEEVAGLYVCPTRTGTLSLRLDLPSFATTFVWNLQVPEAGVARTRARLAAPVSLVGEVAESDVTVRLVPRGLDGLRGQDEFAGKTEELPRGGAVRFEGVAPGAYAYRLEGPGGSSAEAMIVVPGSVTELELPALSLPARAALSVQVTPPDDGTREPWVLRLVPRATNPHRTRSVTAATDPSGWRTLPRVEAGEYLLLVEDSAGSLWLTEELALEADETRWLDLPRVAVEGRATRGEEPFVGDLIFGGTYGSRKFTFATDEDGRFSGFLPEAGSWEVEISSEATGCAPCDDSPGSVRIPPVEVEEGPSGKAWLDVEIPDTRLTGRVVVVEADPSGETVRHLQPGATIFVTRVSGPKEGRGRQAQIWSDDGEFELVGLAPGEVHIGAMHPDLPYESDWRAVRIEDGKATPPAELVLRPKVALTVRLSSSSGPVGGATVIANVPDGKSARGLSGADGTVVLDLAPGHGGTLVVEAEGYGVVLEPFWMGDGSSPPPEVRVSLVPAAGSLVLSHLPYDVFREGTLVSGRGGTLSLRAFASLLADSISFGETLTLDNLSPGTYAVCTERGDCWQDVVFPDAPTQLDLSETK